MDLVYMDAFVRTTQNCSTQVDKFCSDLVVVVVVVVVWKLLRREEGVFRKLSLSNSG